MDVVGDGGELAETKCEVRDGGGGGECELKCRVFGAYGRIN